MINRPETSFHHILHLIAVEASSRSRAYNRPREEQLSDMTFPGFDEKDEYLLPVSTEHYQTGQLETYVIDKSRDIVLFVAYH